MSRQRNPAFFLSLLLALVTSGVAGQSAADVSGERGDRVAAAYREGFAAFRRHDYAGAADIFRQVYDINPQDDATVYFIAAAYTLGGDKARAVGAANGSNPLPIVLPCHRVIGADGSLTGFGGGLHVKRFLLELEGALLPLG